MNEKLPLLQKAIEQLKENEETELADELDALVATLFAQIEKKEHSAIQATEEKITQFLETHEAEITIGDRQEELATLKWTISSGPGTQQKKTSRRARFRWTDEQKDETAQVDKEEEWSRRDSRWKKVALRWATLWWAFFALKRRWKNAPHTTSMELVASNEHLWPQRQKVITEMEKIIVADKKNPIGYDFNDCSLENDRDINCSWLVYEVVQKRAWFSITAWWVTSASLYQSMIQKWRPHQPLLQKEWSPNTSWVQPWDTIFRCSRSPNFKRKNGSRPAKVNGMPVHHSALVQSVQPDGHFTVLESTGSAWVQVKEYDAKRWLEKRNDELHVVKMPYDPVA